MSSKIIFIFCAQAFLVELALAQCINHNAYIGSNYGLITPGLADTGIAFANPCNPISIDITATSGGNLPVSSFSALPPSGLFIASENLYEGILAAAGELPFVGTAGVDSLLPTAGAGAVNYGCGNGNTAMVSETIPAAAAFSPAGFTAPIGVAPAAIAASYPASSLGYATVRGYGCGLY